MLSVSKEVESSPASLAFTSAFARRGVRKVGGLSLLHLILDVFPYGQSSILEMTYMEDPTTITGILITISLTLKLLWGSISSKLFAPHTKQ